MVLSPGPKGVPTMTPVVEKEKHIQLEEALFSKLHRKTEKGNSVNESPGAASVRVAPADFRRLSFLSIDRNRKGQGRS